MPTKSYAINPALNEVATEVNSGCFGQKSVSGLRSARCSSERSERCSRSTTNKNVAVGVHVKGSIYRAS